MKFSISHHFLNSTLFHAEREAILSAQQCGDITTREANSRLRALRTEQGARDVIKAALMTPGALDDGDAGARFEYAVRRYDTGHAEALLVRDRVREKREKGDCESDYQELTIEQKAEINRDRAKAGAAQRIRDGVKSMGLVHMLTLTSAEPGMNRRRWGWTDAAKAMRAFFREKGYRYVQVFGLHEDGRLHIHAGISADADLDAILAHWRSVAGEQSGADIVEIERDGDDLASMSTLANYLSKNMRESWRVFLKADKRVFSSRHSGPVVEVMTIEAATIQEAAAIVALDLGISLEKLLLDVKNYQLIDEPGRVGLWLTKTRAMAADAISSEDDQDRAGAARIIRRKPSKTPSAPPPSVAV